MEQGETFEGSLSHWMAMRCLNRKPKTVKFYREVHNIMLREWPAPGIAPEAIQPSHILTLAERCQSLCPSRWNVLCAALAGVVKHLPRLKRKRLNCRRFVPPSDSQFSAFLAALDVTPRSHAGLITRFYCLSGLRFEEGMGLKWGDVREDGLDVPACLTKSGVGRFVPFLPGMAEVLDRLRSLKVPGDFVLPQKHPRKAMENAARVAGIGNWSPHLCRHYFATISIQSGVDIPTVARWLGHQDGGALLSKVYFHLADEHSREMAAKVRMAA